MEREQDNPEATAHVSSRSNERYAQDGLNLTQKAEFIVVATENDKFENSSRLNIVEVPKILTTTPRRSIAKILPKSNTSGMPLEVAKDKPELKILKQRGVQEGENTKA